MFLLNSKALILCQNYNILITENDSGVISGHWSQAKGKTAQPYRSI